MSICYAMALFHRTAFQAIGAILQPEFDLSNVESADLASVFFWTYLLVMIPSGLLADAIGARRVAITGCVLSTLGSILFASANSVIDLTIARIMIASGSAAAFVSMMRFIAVTFPDRKATYSGRGIFMGNLGAIASGAPLVMLLVAAGWRDIWLGLSATSLALGLAFFFVVPRGAFQRHGTELVRQPGGELRTLLTSPYVYLGIVLLAGLAGSFYAFTNFIAPRLLASSGFDPLESGWQVSVLILGYGLGAVFWGWIGDKEHQRTRALAIACLGALACWTSLTLITLESRYAAATLFFVTGACCGGFTLVYPLMTERHAPSHAGGVIACVNCGIPLGAAILQTIAGRVSWAYAPWLLVGAACIALVAAAYLTHDRDARTRGSAIRTESISSS